MPGPLDAPRSKTQEPGRFTLWRVCSRPMCTLIVATREWFEAPLVVLANRDERLDRPAGPPRMWNDGPVPVLAPEDLEAGGTWWGLSARGVFAGITNRFMPPPDPGRVSRGTLVLDALAHETSAEAANTLAALPGDRYNPFHLVVADLRNAHLIWGDGEAIRRQVLKPGTHVFTERSLEAAPTDRPVGAASRLRSVKT